MSGPASDTQRDGALCVALDASDAGECRRVAVAVRDHVAVLKVGLSAWAGAGPALVRELAHLRPVFVDLKLHDIPAQVAGAVEAVAALGARYATVHASGGADMVAAAARARGARLELLAVTVLTSLDEAALRATGVPHEVGEQVVRLADLALGAGATGLVCSALEVGALRARFGPRAAGGPLLVVPGVRPAGSAAGDQRRVATPARALEAGADLVVVGRPITEDPDPGGAARRVRAECSGGAARST